jgi:hypothetical protein
MPLSEHEQRELDGIEEDFRRKDPRIFSRLTKFRNSTRLDRLLQWLGENRFVKWLGRLELGVLAYALGFAICNSFAPFGACTAFAAPRNPSKHRKMKETT